MCIDEHKFSEAYLKEIAGILAYYRKEKGHGRIAELRKELTTDHYLIYLHLILADSNNLESLPNLTKNKKTFPAIKSR